MPTFQFRLPALRQLTRDQRRALSSVQPIIVTGVPGSGKTVVSIYRLLQTSPKPELFTYTRMLRASIKSNTFQQNTVAANNVHSVYKWFWDECKVFLSEKINDENILYQVLNSNNISFGEVIFDEGQDLPLSFYKAIKKISTQISIGADEAQQLYPDKSNITESDLKNLLSNNIVYELTENFRNSYETFRFARQFVPENPRAFDTNILERLKVNKQSYELPYIYQRTFQVEINQVIASIIENYGDETIAILLDGQKRVDYYANIIKGLGVEYSKYHSRLSRPEKQNTENNLKNILITTYKSAKGLEFDNVIMPDFEEAEETNRKSYYVGATRARLRLFIIYTQMPHILNNFDKSTYELL
jgi:DNA helicase IV